MCYPNKKPCKNLPILCGVQNSFSKGNVYGSTILAGYDSRPLREDELHSRLSKTDYGLNVDITWIEDVPVIDNEEVMYLTEWPVILPSDMAAWKP